jgi:microsomal epoxide hydrolase
MTTISPFTIAVPDSQIDQLHKKLENATFPDEFDTAGWGMGVPPAEMKRLVTVWRENFDWRAQERKLNEQLQQYSVPISVDGFGELDIHVIHHRSGKSNAIPLLFIHGCRLHFWYHHGIFSLIN